MRIKVLRNVGRKDIGTKSADNPDCLELAAKKDGSLPKEGEVCEFSKDDAEQYVKTGVGEQTDEPLGSAPASEPAKETKPQTHKGHDKP